MTVFKIIVIICKTYWDKVNSWGGGGGGWILTLFRTGFFFYIYNLNVFKQNVYSHQVLIYLDVPGIPVKKPLQNS